MQEHLTINFLMNMKKYYFFIVILFIGTGFSSCYYDAGDILYPKGNCDTITTVSYNQQVVPLFQQQCYGCHTGGSPSGGIAMGTYASDKAIAANGKLYGSITHMSAYSPMPQGAAKMSSCNINLIKKWIDNGILNN